jgi:DNA gyrase subunit A
MRAVVEVEETAGPHLCLVVTELPYQVNPDNLALKIAELVNDGKLGGIADVRDDSSGRTGQRLVIVLKRDAVPRWCSTTSTSTPSCRTTSAPTCWRWSTGCRAP